MAILIQLINLASQFLSLLIFIWVVLSWILPPYHTVRRTFDRFVEPLLAPIRRYLPPVGMFDFSPFVFIIIVNMIAYILTHLLLLVR